MFKIKPHILVNTAKNLSGKDFDSTFKINAYKFIRDLKESRKA